MQSIAEENNLAETAFLVRESECLRIRWFTPSKEVKLCGHATLASAYVLFEELGFSGEKVTFESLSGPLHVTKTGDLYSLDFPAQIPVICETLDNLATGIGETPVETLSNEDYLVVLESEEQVLNISPNHGSLSLLGLRGVIVTAPSKTYDFVVRFFAPKYGIPEDSVTGSAYTQAAPYWAEKMGKAQLTARQVSSRGGSVFCEVKNGRVVISGKAVKYMVGSIFVA